MSEHINDGGPAFPLNKTNGSGSYLSYSSQDGMTLHDYFAAKAMQAHIAAAWSHPTPSQNGFREWKASLAPDADEPSFADWIAYVANLSADAMLKAREVKA